MFQSFLLILLVNANSILRIVSQKECSGSGRRLNGSPNDQNGFSLAAFETFARNNGYCISYIEVVASDIDEYSLKAGCSNQNYKNNENQYAVLTARKCACLAYGECDYGNCQYSGSVTMFVTYPAKPVFCDPNDQFQVALVLNSKVSKSTGSVQQSLTPATKETDKKKL